LHPSTVEHFPVVLLFDQIVTIFISSPIHFHARCILSCGCTPPLESTYTGAIMSNNQAIKKIWSITEDSEKNRVMQQFIKKHGEHYTQEDFLKHLAKRYKVTYFNPWLASDPRKEH